MRGTRYAALLALACALWASASAGSEAPRVAQLRLAVKEPPRVRDAGELRAGGVLRLRVLEPGRLEVKVGGRVVTACHLGWGESGRLHLFEAEEDDGPDALPKVVSGEPGREEVEVALPEEVEGEEAWVELTYAWGWKHEGKPALERRWRLVESAEQALARAFEQEFPLGELAQAEADAEPSPEQDNEEPEWLEVPLGPEEGRPGVEGQGDTQQGPRRARLEQALAAATAEEPQALLELESEALALLTAEQRRRLLETVLSGPALDSSMAPEVVALLTRVVVATPEEDFAALERALTRPEALTRLLSVEGPQPALLGQAFTLKALSSAPLPLDTLEALPGFQLGRQGEESHLLNVPLQRGEAGETLLRFGPVRQRFEARYLSTSEVLPKSRPLRPREWVRVELHGPTPQTRLMTALELALHTSEAGSGLVWAAVGRISELHLLYGGVAALARAPLAAGAAGAAVESATAGAARPVAVRAFSARVGLVALLAGVDSHREELSRTPAGRSFLAVHDVALLALAARDVGRLVTSGVLREWARRGAAVLGQMGAKGSAGLRESLEAVQALARAVDKVLAQGKAVATGEGLTFRTPEGARALRHAWFAVRGEMAAERALGGLRKAGALTPEVERALSTLRQLGEQSEAWARAWSAVARRAAALPSQEARQYLEAVEALRAAARPAAQRALAELLRGSGRMTRQAPGLFLKEAQWLVSRPGLEQEALDILARKASQDRLDLRWLGSTSLATEDLNFLARDKRTPWRVLKDASEQPDNLLLQLQARRLLRGIAGELVTEGSAGRLFPSYKLRGRQVLMEDGHIIDFELEALDGTIRRALEVKGWTADTWRRALTAWARAEPGAKLDPRQAQLIQQLERLAEQLKDAARPPRGKPFLVCTDKMSQQTLVNLRRFLSSNSLAADIESMRELEMVTTTRRLRAAFNLPEKLPAKEMGGAP